MVCVVEVCGVLGGVCNMCCCIGMGYGGDEVLKWVGGFYRSVKCLCVGVC